MIGTVTSVKPNLGYAFARSEEDHITRFVHVSEFITPWHFDTLHEGQRIEFDDLMTDKGPRAVNITIVEVK